MRRLLLLVTGVLATALALFALLAAILGGSLVAQLVAGFVALGAGAALLWWLVVRRVQRLDRTLRDAEAVVAHGAEMAGGEEEDDPADEVDALGRLAARVDVLVRRLRANYEELKEHEELRRRMVANVSHELRTPLTSIQGYLETARNDALAAPDLQHHLDICLRESKKLSRLVQDLFELSKLDNQKLEFHFETVSLVEVADQVGAAFEQRMADKGLVFETRFPPDDPLEVRADGNRIGQVVTNLLGNAAVFTPEGGSVTLACERGGPDKVVLRVSDTGVGIPPKDLPHIFESFFHLEKSRTRNLGGTGLGLAICKAIVEAHKGAISVESRLGEGTTFTVALDAVREAR